MQADRPLPDNALEPCPFCGRGECEIKENGRTWTGMRWGEPSSVSVWHWCTPIEGQPSRAIERVGRDRASAIAAWNMRAALATLQGLSPAQATLTDERSAFINAWREYSGADANDTTACRVAWVLWQARAAIQGALPRGEEPPLPDAYYITDTEQGSTHWYTADQMREYRATPPLAPSVVAGEATACPKCEGLGVVDDGWLTHSAGGIEYEEPIKCVKDCPACKGRATPPAAAGAATGWQPIETRKDEA